MLHEFITQNREQVIRRCRAKVQARAASPPSSAELEYGIPTFLDQLVQALRYRLSSSSEMESSAARHGRDLQLQGFTVSQVVHDYGDVCQSITDLACEMDAPIVVEDFRTLNRCLDDAIASAVTEHGRGLGQSLLDAESARAERRFGFLAHEIRNLVNTASLAYAVLQTGNVGTGGSTGRVLERSLAGLRDLVDRSVAEVRLHQGLQVRADVVVSDLIEEIASGAALEAGARGLEFTVQPGVEGVVVHADRQIVAAVIVNLLQNAFKFTRPGTTVALSVTASADRVQIDVADECGGLPVERAAEVFHQFERRRVDRTGLGLGLAFCRWGADVNDGCIQARNLPGHGCVFALDLPRVPALPLAIE